MRLIIAGGRGYRFTARDVVYLDGLREVLATSGTPVEAVLSGGAPGADACGEEWARSRGIPLVRFPADWIAHGKAAGPIRNRSMAEDVKPDGAVVLFPGGRGTHSMRMEAVRAGIVIFNPAPGAGGHIINSPEESGRERES